MKKVYCDYKDFVEIIRRYNLTKEKLKKNRINKPKTRTDFELNRLYNGEIEKVDDILKDIASRDQLFAEILSERFINKIPINKFEDSESIYLCPRQITRLYPKKSWEAKYNEILCKNV